jgi:hypothetical protein
MAILYVGKDRTRVQIDSGQNRHGATTDIGHFYKHPAPINFIIEPVAKMESGLVFMS